MGGRERAASFGVRELLFCPIQFHLCVPDDVRAVAIGRALAWVFGIIVGVYQIQLASSSPVSICVQQVRDSALSSLGRVLINRDW